MKKFFKDVIGELRNPSEDAEKVLDVIRRVVRAALFMSVLSYLINLGWGVNSILSMYREGYLVNFVKYSERGLFGFIFPYAKSLIRLILNIILFILCNKSVKTDKFVKSKVFLATLITLIVLKFTSFSFNIYNIIGLLFNLTITASIFGIILFTFWDIKDENLIGMELNKKRLHRTSILGYTLLILHLIKQVINVSTSSFHYILHFIEMQKYTGVTIWEWFAVLAIILSVILSVSLLALLIFSLIGRKKELLLLRNKAYLLIVMLFVSILTGIFEYFTLGGGYLYFIAFAIAVSYQNKYKVFDNIGNRIFKKTITTIKEWINNYLSFKE